MNLGLQGRSALLCAASRGLGKACALTLAQEGVSITIAVRIEETLRATAHNVTINNLLSGQFATDRLHGNIASAAQRAGLDPAVIAKRRTDENPAKRFGEPAEFGFACAFLCAAHAGFMNGQNMLLDGGAYPGTF